MSIRPVSATEGAPSLLAEHEQQQQRSRDQHDVRDGFRNVAPVALGDACDAEVDPLVPCGDAAAAHATPGDLVSLHVVSRDLTPAVKALVPPHGRSLGRLRSADYWTNG
jgi:hypothetical protein